MVGRLQRKGARVIHINARDGCFGSQKLTFFPREEILLFDHLFRSLSLVLSMEEDKTDFYYHLSFRDVVHLLSL